MSWAEIKKAVNSNLDVPLNDYERSGNVVASGTPSGVIPTGTFLNISGKGFLHYFLIKDNVATSAYSPFLKITLDGNIVLWYRIHNVHTYTSGFVMGMTDRQFGVSYNTYANYQGLRKITSESITLNNITIYADKVQPIQFSPNEQTIDSRPNGSYEVPVIFSGSKPLVFNHSLLVEIVGGSFSDSSISAYCYELLD